MNLLRQVIMFGFIFNASFGGARTLEIEWPCAEESLLYAELDQQQESVGELTARLLDDSGIPWLGSKQSIVSINGSPFGDDAIVLIDDFNLLAYGWCYEVDGVIHDLMPDEFILAEQDRQIRWFYGFAEYSSGQWLNYCKSYPAPIPPNLCQDF